MADKPEIGKTYKVINSRKGTFFMRVTELSGDFISGIVVDGFARALMSYNVAYVGDPVSVRDIHSLFYECAAEHRFQPTGEHGG